MAFNQTIAQLAMATYGRALAKSGMDHYDNLLRNSILSENDIRNEFMSNAEAAVRYPSSQSNQDTVKQIFNNVLGRDPVTQVGIDHYSNLLSTGQWTQSDLVGQILTDARGASGGDKAYLDSRVSSSQTSYNLQDQLSVFSNTNYTLGTLSSSSTFGVSALTSGNYWDVTLDTVTFGFNQSIPSSYYEYGTTLTAGWTPLTTQQQNAVYSVTSELNKLLAITLEESSANPMIQFNMVSTQTGVSGFAFYPGTCYEYDGDVFLSSDFNVDTDYYALEAGKNGYSTIAHELGHALGLKHSFEGNPVLLSSVEDTNHSIMSYTARDNFSPEFTVSGTEISMHANAIMPDLYALYDVAALQSVYGVNTTTNLENNTYTLSYNDYSIQTIWDAGGEDTIDLSTASGASTVDLRAGTINSADQRTLQEIITIYQAEVHDAQFNNSIQALVTDIYNNSELYTGKNNLSIANGVIIENINTGSGSDTIIDNEVNNNISTSGGNDKIYLGHGGYDYVNGGEGIDTLYIDLLLSQTTVTLLSTGNYILVADSFVVEFIGIESIIFNDAILSI